MTGGPDPETDGRPVEAFTRRTVLRLAGLLGLLGQGAAAKPTGDRTGAVSASAVVAPRRTATLEGPLGQWAETVDVEGATALVGLPPSPDSEGPETGRVAVLGREDGQWVRGATLRPDGDGGQFGRAVALDGGTAAIGAELGADPTGDHAGSVAVFGRDGDEWRRRATLSAPESSGVDRFGTAVGASGETLLVGASTASTGDRQNSGAAFEFTRSGDGWEHAATLVPPEGVERFGRAVAVDGDTAVVGARRTGDAGAAVVYHRSGGGWRQVTELAAPRGHRRDGFGSVLATDGRTVVVGAPGESNGGGVAAGSANVFVRRDGDYRRVATLRDDDGGSARRFGAALALDGGVALVGARRGGPQVFGRTSDGWARVGVLRESGDGPRETPTVVALDGSRAVVGESRPDRPDEQAGSVEVFEP